MVFINDLGSTQNDEYFFAEKKFKNIRNLWHTQIMPNENRVVIEMYDTNSYHIYKMHELKFISIIKNVAFLQIGNSRIQVELNSEIQKKTARNFNAGSNEKSHSFPIHFKKQTIRNEHKKYFDCRR